MEQNIFTAKFVYYGFISTNILHLLGDTNEGMIKQECFIISINKAFWREKYCVNGNVKLLVDCKNNSDILSHDAEYLFRPEYLS